jgi:hypothetical protein
MEILKFIFVLGINFSIFGFIWGIFMFIIRSFQDPKQQKKESVTYIFRIVKYFMLVSVTANYITIYRTGAPGLQVDTLHIVVGTIVLGLYLLGKLQNRAVMNQFAQNPMFARMIPVVDPKMERYLLMGSMIYFVFCLLYPQMVDNGLFNWFTESITSIYETPVIGWVFSIIAFFFLISIIMRAANVLGRILNGQSITQGPPSGGGSFTNHQSGTQFEQYENYEDEDGFTDYEDVTEEEDNKED